MATKRHKKGKGFTAEVAEKKEKEEGSFSKSISLRISASSAVILFFVLRVFSQ